MYSKAYSIDNNTISTNIPSLIKILENPEFDSDRAIKHYELAIKRILKEYKTVISTVDVESVRLDQIKHLWFITKLITRLQALYLDETEAIYIQNASYIFTIVWDSIKVVFVPRLLKKIHFGEPPVP